MLLPQCMAMQVLVDTIVSTQCMHWSCHLKMAGPSEEANVPHTVMSIFTAPAKTRLLTSKTIPHCTYVKSSAVELGTLSEVLLCHESLHTRKYIKIHETSS